MPESKAAAAERGPRITRRHALAMGAAITGAGAIAVGARAFSWWRQPAEAPFTFLSRDEGALVDSLTEAIFPPGGKPALGGAEAQVSRFMDHVLGHMVPPDGDLLRLLMHALDDGARVTAGGGLLSLSVPDRAAYVEGLLQSKKLLVRQAVTGLVLFLSMGYCGHPEVKNECGWQYVCGYEAL